MTPATFKTLCETLGLTSEQVARMFDVDIRNVHRWQSPKHNYQVPDGVAETILKLVDWVNVTVEHALEGVEAMIDDWGTPEKVDLRRYVSQHSATKAGVDVPVQVHAAALGIIALELRDMGIEPVIHYVPEEK